MREDLISLKLAEKIENFKANGKLANVYRPWKWREVVAQHARVFSVLFEVPED